ncbi:hypothetical protein MMC10_000177 [Thelotrema lepadinum]|nr:hypothetical protein [Thelotrema lepadinum]
MGSPVPHDPYKILGVAKDATLANIRSAHRKLVLTCHPDKFPDEALKAQKADEFHKVQQAYELLSDDQKRAKHDDKIKLAELRAEVLRESGNARKAAGAYDHGPRTPRTGYWEPRREPVVEIRPKPRFYNEEIPLRGHPSPRYEDHDHRSSTRRYEDAYDTPPASSSSKKAAGYAYKDEPRSEEKSSRIQRKWKEATAKVTAEKARVYEDRRKSRDKDRRQDYQSKRYYTSPRVESDDDTDSEVDAFMTPRKSTEHRRRYEPSRKSKREDDSRRKRTDDSDSSEEPDPHKVHHNFQSAAEYILKSRVKPPAEREDRQRPTATRSASSRAAPPPTAPPPPPTAAVDSPKRSSARRGAMSSSKNSPKDRKMPEIVEAAPPSSRRGSYDQSPRNRPNLPTAATSPITPKSQSSPHHPPRAQTMDVHSSEKQPSMRRVQTSPLNTMTSPIGHAPLKSSKLRETHDSGYSSPGTPDAPVAPKASYKYRIAPEPESDDSDISRPTIVPIEPESRRRGERDSSPRTQSHRYDRSSGQLSASSRNAPIRTATWEDRSPPPSRPTAPTRAATSRNDRDHRPLFGEISSPERRGSAHDIRSPPSSGYKVKYSSPIYSEDDVVYGEYGSRRGRGRGDSGAKDADAYAYERGGRHHSPVLGSRTASGRTEVY